jgi:hypothetical protein
VEGFQRKFQLHGDRMADQESFDGMMIGLVTEYAPRNAGDFPVGNGRI